MEIERKFLVDNNIWEAELKQNKYPSQRIVQAYLSVQPECTVRIRIKGEKGFLTIKGKTQGISREEFEYEIPLQDAEDMITSFVSKTLSKVRYEVPFGKHIWEVDVFEGKLEGLIIAEIELSSEGELFELPVWVTDEVSHDRQYYNSKLFERI